MAAVQDQKLVSDEHGLSDHATNPAWLCQPNDGDDQMEQKDQEVAHLGNRTKTCQAFFFRSSLEFAMDRRAMDQFKVKGIKTRLRVNEITPESRARIKPSAYPASDYAGYRALFPKAGVGNWGWVYGVLPETRVLHATFDKAHMFSGAIRFNTAGEECSYNADLSVITYHKGHWGRAGTLAYTTPHDRSNDVLRA
jgi:hypothetical protein